jgi:hypothetical protein
LGSNPSLCGERPVTNRLSYGTAAKHPYSDHKSPSLLFSFHPSKCSFRMVTASKNWMQTILRST